MVSVKIGPEPGPDIQRGPHLEVYVHHFVHESSPHLLPMGTARSRRFAAEDDVGIQHDLAGVGPLVMLFVQSPVPPPMKAPAVGASDLHLIGLISGRPSETHIVGEVAMEEGNVQVSEHFEDDVRAPVGECSEALETSNGGQDPGIIAPVELDTMGCIPDPYPLVGGSATGILVRRASPGLFEQVVGHGVGGAVKDRRMVGPEHRADVAAGVVAAKGVAVLEGAGGVERAGASGRADQRSRSTILQDGKQERITIAAFRYDGGDIGGGD